MFVHEDLGWTGGFAMDIGVGRWHSDGGYTFSVVCVAKRILAK